MGALLPARPAAVGGALRDRRELGSAGALMGHLAAARRAIAALAVDGSRLCEHLPGRATRAPGGPAGPAYPHRARRRRHGPGVPNLLLLADPGAAPHAGRRRSMGGTDPAGTRDGPTVASPALVSCDLGVPHCGGDRWMAGPRLGPAGLVELPDQRNAHGSGCRRRRRGRPVRDARAGRLGAAADGVRAYRQFLARMEVRPHTHHQPWYLRGNRRLSGGRHRRHSGGAGARGRAGPDRRRGSCRSGTAFLVVAIAGTLAGPEHAGALVLTAAAALAGAGLWAQLVEGSPRLLRPFGFYGGLFAVMAASLLTSAPMLIMAAYCVGAPWLQ